MITSELLFCPDRRGAGIDVDSTASTVPFRRRLRTKSLRTTFAVVFAPARGASAAGRVKAPVRVMTPAVARTPAPVKYVRTFIETGPGYQTEGWARWLA